MGIDRLGEYINILDKCLLFEAFMKQKEMKQSHVFLLADILPKFLTIFKNTLSRQDGHGMKIRKFHHTLHIPKAILALGSPLNYTGQTPESNMKENVKQNARRTQKRQHTIDHQTGVRFVETRIISMAHQEAMLQYTGQLVRIIAPPRVPSEVRKGAQWSSTMFGESSDPPLQLYTRNRRLKEKHWKSLHLSFADFISYLRKWIHPHLQPNNLDGDTSVDIFTEYTGGGSVRYHANPLWKKTGWHDWVNVRTGVGGDCRVPCHLLCFLDIDKSLPEHLCLTETVTPGTYALVHHVPEDPILTADENRTKPIYENVDIHTDYFVNENCQILRWSSKVTPSIYNGRNPPSRPEKPTLILVNVKDFCSAITAVPDPNQDKFPHTWIFLVDRVHWAGMFANYMYGLHNEEMPVDRAETTSKEEEEATIRRRRTRRTR